MTPLSVRKYSAPGRAISCAQGCAVALAAAFAVTGVAGLVALAGFAIDSPELMGTVAPVAWGLAPITAGALLPRWLRAVGTRS
ncbi:hypothetical protein [Spongiactinospora sp. TRM90649]|uniref:hypothetical protein n=1 Tax=Spongiactinospora sp. TRM90649 TaxID=3031114 RepID=UPI0023F78EC4|nr:hypothetical protein [Spongiactinospora sp. TRM90649]MDF5753288.1 hypothetical protein [Spongiactinospora sp. TRM90649]